MNRKVWITVSVLLLVGFGLWVMFRPASRQAAPEVVGVNDGSAAREIAVIAKQWEFQPSTITVRKGEPVRLIIDSVDVDHGIAIPELNVSLRLNRGQRTVVEFTADKIGRFSFFCNVFCGRGHGDMRGTLIVE